MKTIDHLRRTIITAMLLSPLGNIARAGKPAGSAALRIGYQKFGTLVLLREYGALDTLQVQHNISAKWTEFPAGPQLLEGLNVGSIDFGTTGETPPIFAQAAGADLVYVGYAPASPAGEAIVVPENSPVVSVAQLKGQRVALNKGSNVHYLLIQALQKAGLSYSDIEPVYLPPSDARAAFERGSVAAWVIWDPFLAAAEIQLSARVIQNGQGLVNNNTFYLGTKAYAQQNPGVIVDLLGQIKKMNSWAQNNLQEVTRFVSPQLGLSEEIVLRSLQRISFDVNYIDDDIIEYQQNIADVFARLKLIPHPVAVSNAIWRPPV